MRPIRTWCLSHAAAYSLLMLICSIVQIQFPRLSYLGLLLSKLYTFFEGSLINPDISPDDAWLEYEGVPLKWHYPLGLLYDLYSGAEPVYPSDSSGKQHDSPEDEEKETLPWKLTLHYSNYPTDQLVKLDVEGKHLHDLYIHSVKEVRPSCINSYLSF
jgi:autophagy-related protein 5